MSRCMLVVWFVRSNQLRRYSLLSCFHISKLSLGWIMSFAKASQHLSKDELGKIQKMKVDPNLEKRRDAKFIDSPQIKQNLNFPWYRTLRVVQIFSLWERSIQEGFERRILIDAHTLVTIQHIGRIIFAENTFLWKETSSEMPFWTSLFYFFFAQYWVFSFRKN